MLCCDLIIAADNVKLGQIETRYALTPFGGGTQRLTRLVGPLRARELIYTARTIEADEAFRIGLVNEVVPLKDLDTRVREICRTIGKSTRRAIQRSKFLIEMATYVNDRGFSYESQIAGEDFASGEPLEKFMEFIAREKKK
jgi:enoyl-CoA hydratase